MQITKNGKAEVKISLTKEASKVETFAAEELQRYIKKISGAELSIIRENPDRHNLIYVGRIERWSKNLNIEENRLQEEGFVIKTVGENLALLGKDDLGTLFSVYTFLEILGCRWFFPGPEGEEIPEREDIEIQTLDIAESPFMEYRGLCEQDIFRQFDYSNPVRYIQLVEWLPKVKLNVFAMYSRAYSREVLEEAGKRGLKVKFGNHSFIFFFIGHKEYQKRAEDEILKEIFDSHPDYYPGRKTWEGFQFCFTHPEVIERVKKNISEFIKEHPYIDSIDLVPEDIGEDSFCNCPRCKAEGSTSERYWKFINKIADFIKQEHPGKRLVGIFYGATREVPEGLKLPDNVDVFLGFSPRCELHSWGDVQCKYNQERLKDVKEQIKHLSGKYFIEWLYWPAFYGGTRIFLPFPIVRRLAFDIADNIKEGVSGNILEYEWALREIKGLLTWCFAKLSWDNTLNADKLMEDYCYGYYKEAGEAMKRYFITLEDARERVDVHPAFLSLHPAKLSAYGDPPVGERTTAIPSYVSLLNPDVVKKCESCLDEAEGLAKNDKIKERVLRIKTNFSYARTLMEGLGHWLNGNELMKKGNSEEAKKEYEVTKKLAKEAVNNLRNSAERTMPKLSYYEAEGIEQKFVKGKWELSQEEIAHT